MSASSDYHKLRAHLPFLWMTAARQGAAPPLLESNNSESLAAYTFSVTKLHYWPNSLGLCH